MTHERVHRSGPRAKSEMSRRGFLGFLAGAFAVACAPFRPAPEPEPEVWPWPEPHERIVTNWPRHAGKTTMHGLVCGPAKIPADEAAKTLRLAYSYGMSPARAAALGLRR